MRIRISKNNIDTLFLALLIFSATALWTTETITLYILVTAICAIYCSFRFVANNKIFSSLFNSKYIWWFTLVLILLSLDAFFRIKASEYNHDFQLFTWISTILVMLLLIDSANEDEMIDKVCNSSVIAAIAICIYIFSSELSQASEITGRLGNELSGNVITVAMYLGYCSIGILVRYMSKRRKKDLLIFFVVSLVMLLTGSKLIVFTFLCEMCIYIRYGRGTKKVSRLFGVFILAIVAIAVVFTNERLYSVIGERTIDFLAEIGLLKNVEANRSNSTIIRLSLIDTSFECFKQNPLFGGGFGTVASQPPYYVYSHCNFLEMLACYGLFGFLMFYSMHVTLFNKIKRVRGERLSYLFVICLIANGLFNDLTQITYSAGWMNYFGLIIGASYLIVCKNRRSCAYVDNT